MTVERRERLVEEIVGHLVKISIGECSLREADVVGIEGDPLRSQALFAVLCLHQDLQAARADLQRQLSQLVGTNEAALAVLQRVEAGDLSVRLPDDRPDEVLAPLAQVINRTIDRLAAQIKASEEARAAERDAHRQVVASARLAAAGELAAGVAHEVNNPLQAIVANASFLVDDLGDQAQRERPEWPRWLRYAHAIDSAAGRCRETVKQLLAFARPAGDGDAITAVPLAPLVTEIRGLLGGMLVRQEVELAVAIDDDTAVRSSRAELQALLLNLLLNALRASSAGGTIRLEARAVPGGVVITVSDEGVGMTEAVRERALEPFFTAWPQGDGNGLGLAIVARVVRSHGGSLDLRSAPGDGTTWTITLRDAPTEA